MKKWLENVKQKRPTQRFMWFAYKVIVCLEDKRRTVLLETKGISWLFEAYNKLKTLQHLSLLTHDL